MELAFAAILYILIFSIGTICIVWKQYKKALDLKVIKIEEEVPTDLVKDMVSAIIGMTTYQIVKSVLGENITDNKKHWYDHFTSSFIVTIPIWIASIILSKVLLKRDKQSGKKLVL